MVFGFEQLEGRTLLSASIFRKGTTLWIVSTDDVGDYIDLVGLGNGSVEVSVNEGASQVETGVKSIVIQGAGGNDDVTASNLNLSGKFQFLGNAGEDTLEFVGSIRANSVQFLGGEGADTFQCEQVDVFAKMKLQLGGGDDLVLSSGNTFHSRLVIDTGSGFDEVAHDGFRGGNTYLAAVKIKLGADDDIYQESNATFRKGLAVDGGSGYDTFDDFGETNTFSKNVKTKQIEELNLTTP
ncbi:MAG: hypothetical protein R3C01_15325 [Planctomycetaceae bacterium]